MTSVQRPCDPTPTGRARAVLSTVLASAIEGNKV